MSGNTVNRATLKGHFGQNCIPSNGDFADLIDAALNQADDGVFKPAGSALCVVAAGDATTMQPVLNLYVGVGDAGPTWSFQLNPRSTPATPATAHAGLAVADATGNACLFIDKGTGNVGVGTVTPAAKLDINGGAIVSGALTVGGTSAGAGSVNLGADDAGAQNSSTRALYFKRDNGDDANAGKLLYRPGWDTTALFLIGAGANNKSRQIQLMDNVVVSNNLEVNGSLTANGTFGASGAATLGSSLKVTGTASAASLTVTGAASAASLNLTGAASGASLSVSGAASVASLSASGTASAASLSLTGAASVGGRLTAQGGNVYLGVDPSDTQGNPRLVGFQRDSGDDANAGKLLYKPTSCNDTLVVYGAGAAGSRKIKLYDALEVTGNAAVDRVLTSNGGQVIYPRIDVYRDLHFQNGAANTEKAWTQVFNTPFTKVYTAYVIMQGYSLWDTYSAYMAPHSVDAGDIPQVVYVKLGNFNTTQATGVSYCSCSNGKEGNDSVLFTLVVIGY